MAAETQILQVWDRVAVALACSAKAQTELPELIRVSTYPAGRAAVVPAAVPAVAATSIQIAAVLDMSVARAEAMAAVDMAVAVAQAVLVVPSASFGRAIRARSPAQTREICKLGA